MIVVLGTVHLAPVRLAIRLAPVALENGPGPRQRTVDNGHLVAEEIAIVLVEIDPLPDDGLVVLVQRNAAAVERARSLEIPGLDLERVVASVAVGIDPFADRVAEKGWLHSGGPIAPVGEDAAVVVDVLDQDVGGVRRYHELDLAIAIGNARHAGREAGIGRCRALAAGGLRLEVLVEYRLIFRRQWRLLPRSPRLAGIEPHRAADHPPLALEVGIERLIPCSSVAHRRAQGQYHRNDGNRAPIKHGVLPQTCRSAVAAVTSACSGISGSPSLPALLEIAQVRWRLVFARRHQQAVRAQHVVLLADGDVRIAFGADVLEPDEVALAAIRLDHRPGAGERIVDGGDLVDQDVGIALVERDALLDDGLVVLVQRKPGGLERARAL